MRSNYKGEINKIKKRDIKDFFLISLHNDLLI